MILKDMIKVMQHYADGGEVEFELKDDNRDKWTLACSPSWNWIDYNYRIKETKQKVTIEKWLMQSTIDKEYLVVDSSSIENYILYKKVKFIKSYEVEL